MDTIQGTNAVKAAIEAFPAPFYTQELVEKLPEMSRDLIDQVLVRMVRGGALQRLGRGYYRRAFDESSPDSELGRANMTRPAPSALGSTGGKASGKTSSDALNTAGFIWGVADDVLRGHYKPHQYGSVIIPFTVIRRLDCVLEPTKRAVVNAYERHKSKGIDLEYLMEKATNGLTFWNTSRFTFASLLGDAAGIRKNLVDYIAGFSENIRDVFDCYKVVPLIADLAAADILFLLVKRLAAVNLHPNVVSNADMGSLFEELIRKFAEDQNESPGEHYTPRDAIHLMVELLFATNEDATLSREARIVTLYDPAAGTGGMLSVAEEYLRELNSSIIVKPFGEELNPETYAVCKADMLIKGQDITKIVRGNTLSNDAFPNETFDYMLSNPPYGYDWKAAEDAVKAEHRNLGNKGRFGPGLPRISDGQMLFLMTLVSKMHPKDSGETSRAAIVLNGSPLFTGGAGSGESEIRKYLIESDLVEAIVALPSQMFYNTGINTYVWILSNNKEKRRKGKIQLIDASQSFEKMRKSLGDKRRHLSEQQINAAVKTYRDFIESDVCKILPTQAFGYQTITVERPLRLKFQCATERLDRLDDKKLFTQNGINMTKLKGALTSIDPEKVFKSRQGFLKSLDATLMKAGIELKPPQRRALLEALSERDDSAEICLDGKGQPEADTELRDTENVPLGDRVDDYFERAIKPYVSDAWIEASKTAIGYEIPFSQQFYKYVAPRALHEIDKDLDALTAEIRGDLKELAI